MEYEIIFRPLVKMEIEEAAKWYEEHRKGLAQLFLEDISSVFEQIKSNPAIFQQVYRHVRRVHIKLSLTKQADQVRV